MAWVLPRPCTASSQAFSVNALRDSETTDANDKEASLDHVTLDAWAAQNDEA